MASLSTAGAWLQRSLLALCSNVHSSVIQLNADVIASLVSYCESAPPSDAKEYLNVEIAQTCKYIGVGPGGFYKPGYGSKSKMHLHMMCLGLHWEPMTRSYEMKRSIDNASPPGIPPLFETLVAECLRKARHAVSEKQKNVLDMVPEMQPNICLVNFYDHSGKLGLHQDRDESQESLKNKTPIVSFSIGDSAVFMYGDERDVDAVETIVLESGDVLIFGGPSRMIYHGVSSILPHTAPSWLIEKTNLRPGRMNLTFRQS